MPRIILLTGAPTHTDVLQSLSSDRGGRHVGLDGRSDLQIDLVKDSFPPPTTPARASTSASGAAWRLVHPHQAHLPSGLTQDAYLPRSALRMETDTSARSRPRPSLGDTDVSFLTVTSASASGAGAGTPGPDVHSDNDEDGDENADLERSFSLHVDPQFSETTTWASLLDAAQLNETSPPPPSSPSDRRRKRRRRQQPALSSASPPSIPTTSKAATTRQKLSAVRLTPLSSIPSASQIRQMHPNTITANLVVAVGAIEPVRTLTPARTGRPVDLAELRVADHTRPQPPLRASFWLEHDARTRDTAALRAAIARLRTGDVVLLRRVALRQFRGEAAAQSLGRRAGCSAVVLLWRRGHNAQLHDRDEAPAYDSDALDVAGEDGTGAFEAHLRRVREWALRSIAPAAVNAELATRRQALARPRTRAMARAEAALPPDESQG